MKTRTLCIALGSLVCLALLAGFSTSGAQTPPPPVSPQDGSAAPTWQLTPSQPDALEPPSHSKGFVPLPRDLSHLTGQRMPSGGVSIQSLPSEFDWRDTGKVTSVKNQSTCGSCYAFAALGSIESKLLIDGAGTFDFSENHTKECNWQETDGSGTSCDGGSYFMVANLFSQKGTVLETCDPYVPSDVSCKSTCPYQKTLLDWRLINGDTVPDTGVLKQYIHTYGPVFTVMYAGHYDAWDTEFGSYDGSYTLYHPGTEIPNHGVLIVGWDDSLAHAGGTGGWIVKNSWGTGWGESGYFKIAYGSANIGMDSSFMYDWQDYDVNGDVMYYDEAGGVGGWGYEDTTGWGLVKFTPASNTYATRVEFWTWDATTDIDIYIYDDFDGNAPTNLRQQSLDHSFNEAGYHSVPLASPLSLSAGDDVIVVVKFTTESDEYPIPVDIRGPSETGRTYKSHDGTAGSWSEPSYDVAIRLRTSSVSAPDVRITKRVVGSDFEPGDSIAFALDIANNGTGVASDVVVTDILPDEVLNPTYDSTLVVTPVGGDPYVWNVEPLGLGESGVITIYGQIDPGLESDFSFENTATISDPEDATPGNNTSSVTVGVHRIYLPLVVRCWPLVPYLQPIDNPDGDGIYTASWSWPSCGPSPSYYQLQSDDNSLFSSSNVFTEYDTAFDAYSPAPGTYYWRVRAYLSGKGWSEWSNVQSVTVSDWFAYVWVDNQSGDNMTVEIVGIERKGFSPGYHYWRSIPTGRYAYRAWLWCGSVSDQYDFTAGGHELTFWCGYGAASTSEAMFGVRNVDLPPVLKDLRAVR